MSFNTNDKFNTLSGTLLQTTTISASILTASLIQGPVSGLTIGTNVQAYDATLAAVAGVATATDTYIYFTATDTATAGTITSFGRSLIDDANNTAARTTLGLGTIATQNSNAVTITGGSFTGTSVSASTTLQAGGAISGSGGLNISGGPTNLGGGAGQNVTISTGLVVSGPTPTFSNPITASSGITGSIAKFTEITGSQIEIIGNIYANKLFATSSLGRITIGTGSNDSLIEIATPGGSTYRGIRILSGSTEKWFAGVDTANDYVLRTNGSDRFQFFEEGRLQIIQTTNTNTSGLYFNSGTVDWYVFVNSTNDLYFQYEAGANGGFISDTVVASQMNFTGQHRNMPDPSEEVDLFLEENEGLIVVSAGAYNNVSAQPNNKPTINESLPKIKLSNVRNQKSVFGVIAEFEDPEKETREWGYGAFRTYMTKQDLEDNRIIVNAVGEGAIWVCNINGNLENGDYITTCEIPGHGMKQDDDLLHNYTVAKITQDCSFELNNPNYDCVEFQFSGSTYRKAFVGCTYHCG